MIIHENNWRLTSFVTNKKVEQVAVYFGSTCCPTALYMLNMKKMMRAEIICPHGPRDSQANGQRDRERKKFGKILFLKIPFINSLYLWTGILCYHHTKMKLKFKKMNRYAVGPKIELKLFATKRHFLWKIWIHHCCLLIAQPHHVTSDLKSKNISK